MTEFDQFFTRLGITDPETREELAAQLKLSAFEMAVEQLQGVLTEAERLTVARVAAAGQFDPAAATQLFGVPERQPVMQAALTRAAQVMTEAIQAHQAAEAPKID